MEHTGEKIIKVIPNKNFLLKITIDKGKDIPSEYLPEVEHQDLLTCMLLGYMELLNYLYPPVIKFETAGDVKTYLEIVIEGMNDELDKEGYNNSYVDGYTQCLQELTEVLKNVEI